METTVIASWRRHLMLGSGLLMLLSSLAHSFLGWKQLGAQLRATGPDEDLYRSLAMGWHLGGVAMAAFGVIVLLAWMRARRGDASGLGAIGVIALAYVGFGAAAFVALSFNPFFLFVFVLPGSALAAAVWSGARRSL
jgi:hypothetical protein